MKRFYTKSSLLMIFLSLFAFGKSFSQASVYLPYTITYAANSTTLPTSNVVWASPYDDSIKVITPGAGFSFPFAGVSYTNFLISTNGWVAPIPSSAIPAYFLGNSYPANNLTGYAGPVPIIAPMWDDIISNSNWSVTATDLTIRWNAKTPKNSSTTGYLIGVKLSSNGVITLIYPTISLTYKPDGSTLQSGSIGIADGCGEFYSFTPITSGTASYSDITENASTHTQIQTTITSGAIGSPVIGVASTAGIVVGMFVGGTNIPVGAYVIGIGVGTVTLSTNATAVPSGLGNFFIRPDNINYILTPKPPANDACVNAISLGTISGTCSYVTGSNVNATSSGAAAPTCAVTVNDTSDVWYSFFKPALTTSVRVSTAPLACPISLTGTTIELYTSCGGTLIDCKTGSTGANPTYGEINVVRPCAAETLYVRVVGDNNKQGKFQICATTTTSTLGFTCSNAQRICTLPASLAGTTAGAINNYDSTNAVCHTTGMNGEDYVYAYTPAANECVTITLNSADANPGVFVYSGCPDSTGGVPTYCMATAEVVTGTATISTVTLTAGVTYYIVVDSQTGSINYTLNVSSGGGTPANDLCGSAHNFGSIGSGVTCTYTTFTTACSTPSTASPGPGFVPAPTCVPNATPRSFIDGVTGDVWLRFSAGFAGTLQISTVQSAINPTANAAMAIYTGASCSALTLFACDYNSGTNGMPLLSIPVTLGTTYWIRVWTENPENAGQFDICFSGNCSPPNDLPCAGINVPLGSTTTSFNTCAGFASEPLNAAQCVAGGTVNTVWFRSVIPSSGQVHVRTHPLTLTDTQIQAYTSTGGCSNTGTFSSKGCNDDGPNCAGGFQDFSDLNYTGLTPGDTLYIAVDGTNSLTGSFEITIIDGTATAFPPIPQQDCAGAQVICSTSNITVADPGFRNYGNICDLPSGNGYCWFGTGERNSVWYTFTTSGAGSVKFDINTASSTDIDFILWDVTGQANPCASIASSGLASAGCNYAASLPQTGLMDPPLNAGYANSVPVTGTHTFILLMNVFNSATNAGYTIDWQGTPIAAAGTTAIWSGGTLAGDTLFQCGTCWGDCGAAPTCGVDATVNPTANLRQPTVTTNQSVRNITINAGATLRIKAGVTLSVCGNFTNNGTLICEPGSTVLFQLGAATQTISGNLIGANAFANLSVNKNAGFVILNSNIDVRENFVTSTVTSQFNINGKLMRVAGNFTNASGKNTFLTANLGNSILEFNGVNNQYFTNLADTVRLNRLTMNKPTGKLYLMGANSSINVDTTVTLTSGIINTRNVAANFVYLKWVSAAAISGYSAISYIDGNLKRRIYDASGPDARAKVLDWPVGDSLKGYQLANVLFTAAPALRPGIEYLIGSFDSWTGAPPALGPTATECASMTYDVMPLLDNGYWTFRRDPAGVNFNGEYTMTLYNTNYTNAGGALGWTIAVADLPLNVNSSASWRLAGNCYLPSLVTGTKRYLINQVPTGPGTDFFNLHYAVAQSQIQPLPIELLYFDAVKENDFVVCKWETASETNNDYFNVERSLDGISFEKIGKVEGYGAGVSTINHAYKFIDDDVCNSIRYYRLKQTDIDGKFSYSETVAVNCKATRGSVNLYPNPAKQSITCEFFEDSDDFIEFTILDLTGRMVKQELYSAQRGLNSTTISIEELASGGYYLQIKSVNKIETTSKQHVPFFKN